MEENVAVEVERCLSARVVLKVEQLEAEDERVPEHDTAGETLRLESRPDLRIGGTPVEDPYSR